MARPNYGYEKRQKELAKQKKREEKRQRKLGKKTEHEAPAAEESGSAAPEGSPDEGRADLR